MQIGDSFALEKENNRVKDLIILAEIEDEGVLAKVRAIGWHGAKSKFDAIKAGRPPTLNKEVDDELRFLLKYFGEPVDVADARKPEDVFNLILSFSSILQVNL